MQSKEAASESGYVAALERLIVNVTGRPLWIVWCSQCDAPFAATYYEPDVSEHWSKCQVCGGEVRKKLLEGGSDASQSD